MSLSANGETETEVKEACCHDHRRSQPHSGLSSQAGRASMTVVDSPMLQGEPLPWGSGSTAAPPPLCVGWRPDCAKTGMLTHQDGYKCRSTMLPIIIKNLNNCLVAWIEATLDVATALAQTFQTHAPASRLSDPRLPFLWPPRSPSRTSF